MPEATKTRPESARRGYKRRRNPFGTFMAKIRAKLDLLDGTRFEEDWDT